MSKVRLRYSKTGKAKYISHLDLTATIRRALLRAGVRLKYSEGFNPHPYISVALPLPVGCASVCELMDVGLAEDAPYGDIIGAANASLPEGIHILDAYAPERKFSEIAWIELSGVFDYDSGAPRGAAEKLAECFSREKIIIQKKTKRGAAELDIAEYIKHITFSGESSIMLSCRVSAQNPSINTDNILSALDGGYCLLRPDYSAFTRLEKYDAEMKVFR